MLILSIFVKVIKCATIGYRKNKNIVLDKIIKIVCIFYAHPDFQNHGVDNAANNSDEIEHVPRVFEEILSPDIFELARNRKIRQSISTIVFNVTQNK